MATGIVLDRKYMEYSLHPQHIESPDRLSKTIELLEKLKSEQGQFCDLRLFHPRPATFEDVSLVHSKSYIKFIMDLSREGYGQIDYETFVNKDTYKAATFAAGGAIKAVDVVAKKDVENSFALVRPPGHHASRTIGGGFCYFNNVAIAAEYARRYYNFDNILILDWDAHYGNGTADIFRGDKKTLFVSVDEDFFTKDKRGFVDVDNNIIHLSTPIYVDRSYLVSWSEIINCIKNLFSPDIVICSAGQDGHFTEYLSSLGLSSYTYEELVKLVKKFARNWCNGRLVLSLEGGYNPLTTPLCNCIVIGALADIRFPYEIEQLYYWFGYKPEPEDSRKRMENLLEELTSKIKTNLFK